MIKRPIKILRIQSRICIGGPAIHTEILAEYLPKDKFETIVVGGAVDKNEKSIHERINNKGIHVEIIVSMKRNIFILNDLVSLFRLYRLIKQNKPDIVHTHTAKAGTIGRISAYLARVPIIVHTFHGHVFNNYFNKFITKIFIVIEKCLAKLTRKIIVISDSQYKDIVDTYKIASQERVKIIPLGFDLTHFDHLEKNGKLKNYLGLNSKNILVGCVGRLVPIKNNRMIIRVINKLHESNDKYHLCFIGDGEERENLEAIADPNYVHFLGWRTDLDNIYAGVDVIALTSLNEGTPVALIEAMAANVPVVSTKVGGVGDIVKDNVTGLLVKSNDVDTMCEKIELLMHDPNLRDRLIKQAREYVREKFSYQRLIKDMELLYDELLQ